MWAQTLRHGELVCHTIDVCGSLSFHLTDRVDATDTRNWLAVFLQTLTTFSESLCSLRTVLISRVLHFLLLSRARSLQILFSLKTKMVITLPHCMMGYTYLSNTPSQFLYLKGVWTEARVCSLLSLGARAWFSTGCTGELYWLLFWFCNKILWSEAF